MLSPRYTRSLKLILTSFLPSLLNRSSSTRPGGETTCTTISEHGKDDKRVMKRAATCGDADVFSRGLRGGGKEERTKEGGTRSDPMNPEGCIEGVKKGDAKQRMNTAGQRRKRQAK
ncbi:hypothetical protein B0H13DRAFT_1909429 [Mycena leptocephala]|nr:hypothetical protein B0H13DRAFT_1909429 [Mycena leptocephala]